jgi:hypothetical protein
VMVKRVEISWNCRSKQVETEESVQERGSESNGTHTNWPRHQWVAGLLNCRSKDPDPNPKSSILSVVSPNLESSRRRGQKRIKGETDYEERKVK